MQPARSEQGLFADVLHREVGLLQVQFPALADALSRAYAIVAGGRLFPEDDGKTATVLASDGVGSYVVNGHCTCPASAYRNEPCKHRLALRLYQRVADALLADQKRWEPDNTNPAVQRPAPSPTVPTEHLLMIQGKPFVKFEGLLAIAYARGLVSLETTLVQASHDLAICEAVVLQMCTLVLPRFMTWSV